MSSQQERIQPNEHTLTWELLVTKKKSIQKEIILFFVPTQSHTLLSWLHSVFDHLYSIWLRSLVLYLVDAFLSCLLRCHLTLFTSLASWNSLLRDHFLCFFVILGFLFFIFHQGLLGFFFQFWGEMRTGSSLHSKVLPWASYSWKSYMGNNIVQKTFRKKNQEKKMN